MNYKDLFDKQVEQFLIKAETIGFDRYDDNPLIRKILSPIEKAFFELHEKINQKSDNSFFNCVGLFDCWRYVAIDSMVLLISPFTIYFFPNERLDNIKKVDTQEQKLCLHINPNYIYFGNVAQMNSFDFAYHGYGVEIENTTWKIGKFISNPQSYNFDTKIKGKSFEDVYLDHYLREVETYMRNRLKAFSMKI